MQFNGAKGIAFFVAIVLIACGVGFGSGLLVGRYHPAHNFEKFGNSTYLLDSTTGKICDPFKDPKANPVDSVSSLPPGFVMDGTQDKNGFQAIKPASNYQPACSK